MRLFKKILALVVLGVFALSCATKKDVMYLQDNAAYENATIVPSETTIQPDDILKITVGAIVPEAAIPYNKLSTRTVQSPTNIEIMKLEGYIVSPNHTIEFPILGEINVADKTTQDLAQYLKIVLEKDGHLNNPTVDVRLVNGKFTVLGEVKKPGTFTFTENTLTVFQALGFAGDLTIEGQRDDVLLIREIDGSRTISHIDLTTTNWFDTELYHIKPNDVIVVNPNTKKVKSSGMVGDTSTIIAIASLVISLGILITN